MIIDCSTLIAGPWAATILGDFGAEVIKIEHPAGGDDLRHHGDDDHQLIWKTIGRNKKSVPIDLHAPEGQAILQELVEDADVLIENFRPGRMEAWNLGWERLSTINPGLIMVRTTGFGQTGPYSDRAGFGTLAESMSGFAAITGQADGPPTLPPFGFADSIAALHSVFAVMFALYWRDVHGGTGQYIDTSILEPIFKTIMNFQVAEYGATKVVRERMGNRLPYTAPRNTYQTKDDRWVAISTSSETVAERVLNLVGGEELAADPRFRTMRSRVENVEALDDVLQTWFAERTREEAIETFRAHDAAIAPIYDIEDIFEDEHFQARGAIVEVQDSEVGQLSLPSVVPKLSETPGGIDHPGPALGEHTRKILRSRTGLDDETMEDLAARGIIRLPD